MIKMKKIFLSFLLFLGLQPLCAEEIQNPVWPYDWPDPTVWQSEDGNYYCLATNPRRMIMSTDLFHWGMTDISPIDEESWQKMRAISRHYWAPDVRW